MWRRVVVLFVAFFAHRTFAGKSNEEARLYIRELQEDPTVITLKSGMMYQVYKWGHGEESADDDTIVQLFYNASRLSDGLVFDTSFILDEPVPRNMAPSEVATPWRDAMKKMVIGDHWKVYLPAEILEEDTFNQKEYPVAGDLVIIEMEYVKFKEGPYVPAERCEPLSRKHCNHRQKDYLNKYLKKAKENPRHYHLELQRLERLTKNKLPVLARSWVHERVWLLERMRPSQKETSPTETPAVVLPHSERSPEDEL